MLNTNTLQTTTLIALMILVLFLIKKVNELLNSQKPSTDLLEVIKMLQDTSSKDRQTLLESLQKNTQALNQRLDSATRAIGDVNKNVGEMSEIGRGIKDLQEFLKSPKIRGNIGEQVLKDLIVQTFPKSKFLLQHAFKTGDKVDAAIKTSAGILPIDSKFPMENFQRMQGSQNQNEKDKAQSMFKRDLKKHIDDISAKYILPEEGTMDFALMYIPSESVYYEFVNQNDLLRYAQKSRVYPVSPTTLYAHLQTILLSFEGEKIESKAKEVFVSLRSIQKQYEKVEESLSRMQKHLQNAYNTASSVLSGFENLGQKIANSKKLGEGSDRSTK